MVSERMGMTMSCAIFLISVGVCIFWLVFGGLSAGLCVAGCAMALIPAVFCWGHFYSPQCMRFACNGAMLSIQAGSLLLWLWQVRPGHRQWHLAVLCAMLALLTCVGRLNTLHIRKMGDLRPRPDIG